MIRTLRGQALQPEMAAAEHAGEEDLPMVEQENARGGACIGKVYGRRRNVIDSNTPRARTRETVFVSAGRVSSDATTFDVQVFYTCPLPR